MTTHNPISSARVWYVDVDVTTEVGTTDRVNSELFVYGSFDVPSGSSITTITWYASSDAGDTGLPAKDEDGVAIEQTVAAGNNYELPSALAGRRSILPVGDAAGSIKLLMKRSA